MSNPIPSRVGRYEVLKLLGKGSLGPVYLARDPLLERAVAIRVLQIPDVELTRRAADAARSAARLSHPNIVTVYEVGEEQGQPFIAMEYVDGEILADIIGGRAPLSMARRLELIQNLCDGLAYAHRMGVVHTDVQPGQLLITSDGVLKIPLLGPARLTTQSTSADSTTVGLMIGTPQYMSPEQINSREIDHRTDVFSVGLVLYETVTYSRAFPGAVPGVFLRILTEQPRPASQLNPSVDSALEHVIAKALQKTPADRYQTMSEFARDLARIRLRLESDEGVEAAPLPIESPAPKRAAPREEITRRRAARIESLLNAARERLGAGQYAKAIEQCESALLLDSEHVEAVEILDQARGALEGKIESRIDVLPTPKRIDENVQFSVYRPAVMAPARWYSMLVFAHLASRRPDAAPDESDPLEEVARRAQALLGSEASAPTSRIDSMSAIPEEGQLRVVPRAPGLTFDPPEHRFLWLHSVHQVEFNLRADADMEGRTAHGSIDIYLGALAVAHVPMAIPIDSRADQREQPVGKTVNPYRRLFASYSHKDEAIVRQFENYAKGLGDRYVRDVIDLRAGERWSARLCELIESADVFQLFWSQNSMESVFVRREWEHALTVPKPEFIRPVYWELPFPKRGGLPPPALADLQFAFVGTSEVTSVMPPSVSGGALVADEQEMARVREEAERYARDEATRSAAEEEGQQRLQEHQRRTQEEARRTSEAQQRAREKADRLASEERDSRREYEDVEQRAREDAERRAREEAKRHASILRPDGFRMILRLEVSSDSGRLSAPAVFRDAGGTIGRSEKCNCVLPDKYVSSVHARIHYRDGAFLIEDTSQNGVCLNSPSNRLVREQSYPLKSGDLILIDPYEITVTIESVSQLPADRSYDSDPFATEEQLDPIVLIGGDPGKKTSSRGRTEELPPISIEREQYRPPDPILPDPHPSVVEIPDDWDNSGSGEKLRREPPAPIKLADPTPTPTSNLRTSPPDSRATPRAAGELSDVLEGAGLPPDLMTPELAQDFGHIIRIIVSGLMDVLQARQQIKDEFGMQMTVFKQSRNNPLKFSVNVEDALHNLLVKRNPAYLGPVNAFEDAFDDVLYHQMAMLAGMRAAFAGMLKSFSPEALQHEFEKHGKGSLISVPAKMRSWDQDRAKFDDMVADTERCFDELFGQEFARAYDDQLERLKAEKRSRGSKS